MLPYWLLFGFFAAVSLFAREGINTGRRRWGLLIAWLILTLMIGLRWEVGADWGPYETWWGVAGGRSLESFLNKTGQDPGFYTLMWIFRSQGAAFWLLNLAVAAVFATGLVSFARSQANPWLAITVAVPYLVIVVAMSGVRQATAIGFVFLALVAFKRQEGRKFLIWIALAASFHASAILLLPLAGLSFTRTRIQAVVLLVITLVAAYYLLGATFLRYSDRYLATGSIQSSGALFRIAMNLVPALIYLPIRRHFPAEPHEKSLWRNLSLAAVASVPVYYYVASSTALDRLILYLFPLQIYVLSWLPWVIKGPAARTLVTFLVLVYLGLQLFFFLEFAVNNDAYLPYRMLPFVD